MTEISEQHRTESGVHSGGPHYQYKFPNGYGASVIQAVLDSEGSLTYETPITDDVLGYLSEAEVNETLAAIAALEVSVSA
jgi:hypothetical protein